MPAHSPEDYWLPRGSIEYTTENEAYISLLCGHLFAMIQKLRKIPADRWDWTPDQAAPTARILASHTWQWLVCDRQHIGEPDVFAHADIPPVPTDPDAMCDLLLTETDNWYDLLLAMTPNQFDATRKQFGETEMNVRAFVCHMIQNSIYKHGQLATLFFALGLDGTEPYDAPFPNPIYAEIRAAREAGTDAAAG
ncbi:MAG TPA: hypothetical protein VGK19_10665 [Capsulimonadaceae bacterium]|jgi:hypothetical protein